MNRADEPVDMPAPRFDFRPLAEQDLPLLHEWLNRPHMLEWWSGEQSLEDVRQKYLPRIAEADDARPFLALLDGRPVGYVQWYSVSEGRDDWWPDRPGPGVLGIDQFLADGDRLGRGLGTAMVRQFTARLFADPEIREIRVDPRPDNARAVRCYEKVGFRTVGPITTPDGPALMMVLDREGLGRPGREEASGGQHSPNDDAGNVEESRQ